jgi:hypothetical protein|tara:strand:+ start:745 stop:1059 length:315 start_codon:yes stop_codon:yes gene_type:complete
MSKAYNTRNAVHVDDRNYKLEAENMVRPLGFSELYKLYEIVVAQMKRSQSDTRDKELTAVKKAIEGTRAIDKERLKRLYEGYRSSMAAGARPQDGFTKPAKKKV